MKRLITIAASIGLTLAGSAMAQQSEGSAAVGSALSTGLTAGAGWPGNLAGRYEDFVSGIRFEIDQYGAIRSNVVITNGVLNTPVSFYPVNVTDWSSDVGTTTGVYSWLYNYGVQQLRCDFAASLDLRKSFDGTLSAQLTANAVTGVDGFGRCVAGGSVSTVYTLRPQ